MARFLPALRGKTVARRIERAVPPGWDVESKMILSQYVTGLWNSTLHDQTRPWPVERAVAEGFDRVMWVFKAVNTIATDSARLPYRIREGDEGDPLDDHPLYRVLNKKANPLETGQVFRKRLSAQVLLSKRGAFVEVTKSRGGQVIRLDLLPPGRTEPVPGTGADLIDHWRLTLRDGTTREIDVDKVRWFRDPHPLDPYSGVTPLESAGMSVELDYFSRLYNVMFMRNDGRPGGIVAVDPPSGAGPGGDMDPADMDRLESRFGKGVPDAGKISVLSGKVSYADLASRPRDMAYETTARNSKTELLAAFGVPESVMGRTSEETYANAEQGLYNYWTRTMPGHNEIIVAGFDEDSDDGLDGYLDVSGVEVLERGERARREEARTEVESGLRSIHSYATLAGYADEIEETPFTRALYLPQGRTPLPTREEDAKALGLGGPDESASTGGQTPAAASPPAGSPLPGAQNRDQFENPPTAPAVAPAPARPANPNAVAGPADSVDRSLMGGPRLAGAAVKSPHLRVVGGKAKIAVERKAANERTSEPDERAAAKFEDTVAAALGSLAPRLTERVAARLQAPKARRGTRHWKPQGPADTRAGIAPLDVARVVEAERFAEEAQTQAHPLITAAAVAAAAALLADLGGDDEGPGTVETVVAEVLAVVRTSALALAGSLTAALEAAEADGADLDEMVAEARGYGDRVTSWADTVAVQVATATTAGARDAAAAAMAGTVGPTGQAAPEVVRTWFSRRDTKVRHTHAEVDAEQQTRALGELFTVGDALLRYPGDPLGPPAETRNCRCRLRHRVRVTGRFAPVPRTAEG